MHILPEYKAARRATPKAEGCRWAVGRERPARLWSSAVRVGAAFALSLSLLSGCALPGEPWDTSTDGGRQDSEGKAQSDAARKQHRAMVQRTQRLLNDLGYEAGPADGLAGPKTREAIRAYQRKSGLPADGKASDGLLRRLEASRRATGAVPNVRLGDPPAYETGSTYVYSDGRVDIVVGLKGDTVRWQRNDGSKFTTYRNFLLPPVYWQSEAGSGKSTVDGKPWSLWPRSSGREVAFSATTVEQEAGGAGSLTRSSQAWRCRFGGQKRVTVVAGTFDTVKLVCERAAGESAPALRRVWYYAPSIQHFVRLEDRKGAGTTAEKIELTAIRPGGRDWPPIARAALSRAVAQALETVSNGRATPWRSSGVETRVTIEPTSRFRSGEGRLCRTFLQTWSDNQGRRSYPGTACRDDAGRWRIPGLRDGSEDALAVSEELS